MNETPTMQQRPHLSLSHLSVLEVGPPALIDLVADAGFASTGIRLSPAVIGGTYYPLLAGSQSLRDVRQRMASRNVAVLDVEVVCLAEDTDVMDFEPMFETAAELGAQRVCVNGDDPDLSRLTARFAHLCELAKPYGLQVDLEFMRWRPVSTLEVASQIVEKSSASNGFVLLDALHLMRSGGSHASLKALCQSKPKLIGSFQLCDAPLHLSHDAPTTAQIIDEARSGRWLPGEGGLPLREMLACLPLNTPISLEIPMSGYAPQLTALERATRIYQAGLKFLTEDVSITN